MGGVRSDSSGSALQYKGCDSLVIHNKAVVVGNSMVVMVVVMVVNVCALNVTLLLVIIPRSL